MYNYNTTVRDSVRPCQFRIIILKKTTILYTLLLYNMFTLRILCFFFFFKRIRITFQA